MDKVTIYRVLWSTLKLDATDRHGLADVITLEDHRRALDAEREKVKRLSTCGTDHSTPWWQVKCEDLEAQLATLQAQLRKPILVCQRCGRVSQDGWVPSRYECDELNGSLQCPDCQCIDLEINTAKELATLCTKAQARLAAAGVGRQRR